MISNQILQSTIDGIKTITNVDLSVIDIDGKILASTTTKIEDYVVMARLFVDSTDESRAVQGCQFNKVFDEQRLEYIVATFGDSKDVAVVGKMAAFQIQNLLIAYKERFDKDNFIKNPG